MDSNGSLCVLISRFAHFGVLLDFYRSLCVLIKSNGSLYVFFILMDSKGPYESL